MRRHVSSGPRKNRVVAQPKDRWRIPGKTFVEADGTELQVLWNGHKRGKLLCAPLDRKQGELPARVMNRTWSQNGMGKFIGSLFLLLALSVPAFAQAPRKVDAVMFVAAGPGASLMQQCRTSKDACGQFTRLVACALSADGFGLLTKQPGQNQYQGYAVDAIIYRQTRQVIDIIAANESPNAAAGWTEVPRRDGNDWAPAVGCSAEPPPVDPPPTDPPPPSTDAQLAALREIIARLDAQIAIQKAQGAALEAAVKGLQAEIAKGIKVRF